MKLISISLHNFRCFKDEKTIIIDDFTTLIGRNDIGKSSVLEALEIFFNNEVVKIDVGDCSVSSPEKEIEITCEFSDIPEKLILDAQAETNLQNEHLLTAQGNLKIKKKYSCTGSKPKEEVFVCANHPTENNYHDLVDLTNTALKNRLTNLGISSECVQLNNNSSIRQAIWNSCPDLHLSEIEIAVDKEDSKKIWEKLKEYLPLFALFQSDRPSKDSDTEVQDPMKLAVATALAEPEIKQKLAEITEAVRTKVTELATRTHESLRKIDSNLASQIVPEFKSDPKWSGIFSLTLNTEDGIPLNKRGSGIRRLILVSFFRAEAERRKVENSKNSIIYAIEEPETSQHPNNQKILLDALLDLSTEPGCQVLITTHSPGLALSLPTGSFRFIKKGTDHQPTVCTPTDKTWQEITSALGVTPDNRVKVLVCVEGPTDVTALKCLSKALHNADQTILDLSCDPRIAFVVLGGGTLEHWVNKNYLQGLNRPEVHIYDSDVANYADLITRVNSRHDGSWGVQTKKREIENYLHCDAINEGLSVKITVNDLDDIPALIKAAKNWKPNTAKKKLAQDAYPKMDATRIAARDPNREVEGWFRRIGEML
jgi:putative ATP-dependent endonuclease of OLD family